MIDAGQSDLLDVLSNISFLTQLITRVERIEQAKTEIFEGLDGKKKEFLDFVLSKYKDKGVEELGEEKLPISLNLKYHAIANAEQSLGDVGQVRSVFFAFQKRLYAKMSK